QGHEFKLRGVHFYAGNIILTTSSRKWNALPALPHFALSQEDFNLATGVINDTLSKLWKAIAAESNHEPVVEDGPKCELIVWLQQKPLPYTPLYVEQVEDELRVPTGAPIDIVPALNFSAVLFSPDCGYMLGADDLTGPRTEVTDNLNRRALLAMIFVLIVQIMLLKKQMDKTNTPSTRSRVSFETIYMAGLSDGMLMLGLLVLAVLDSSIWLLGGIAVFLGVLYLSILEVQFLLDLWLVQIGDPAEAERARLQRERAAAAVPPGISGSNSSTAQLAIPLSEAGLPLPATARSTTTPTTTTDGATAVTLPFDQNGTTPTVNSLSTNITTVNVKFYLTVLALAFLSFWATTLHAVPRRLFFGLLSFASCSLCTPQIHRNIMRNCRRALDWEYVLGSSLCRGSNVLDDRADDVEEGAMLAGGAEDEAHDL
ncbi:hypothetical protein LTR66_016707, partial [Elasticomyces elasticus]